MNNDVTYKTYHPAIKYIRIGDRFVTNNGKIVTFEKFDKRDSLYSFKMCIGMDILTYTIDLKYLEGETHWLDIKDRLITLKEKINQL